MLNPSASRILVLLLFAVSWGCLNGKPAVAQTVPTEVADPAASSQILLATGPAADSELADSPPPSTPNLTASVGGGLNDPNGAVVTRAAVTLIDQQTGTQRVLTSDSSGNFKFNALPAGTYRVVVAANGFAPWTSNAIVIAAGDQHVVPNITLQLIATTTEVDAVDSPADLATEEVHTEEKQRVLGIVPNFYVTYDWHAPPLSPGQKFQMAWRISIDPISIAGSGVVAGIEQWQNDFSGYGQGAEGFAKRFGASSADGFTSTFLGEAILPVLLHQDPRYFYKGTGSIRSRAFYAISSVVICRGDNGRSQPSYSNILGNLASAGISNLYYPASDRNGVQLTIENSLIGTAEGAVSALFQEFLLHRITPGTRSTNNGKQN